MSKVDFQKFDQIQDIVKEDSIYGKDSIYGDVGNHCPNWNYYKSEGDRITSVHEGTHGCNAYIRNGMKKSDIPLVIIKIYDLDHEIYEDYPEGAVIYGLPQPQYGLIGSGREGMNGSERVNGFYALNNRAIKINEPNVRKRDAINFIPVSLRYYRFATYVSGQSAWDDSPLYLFDEWIAYTNGAACAVQEKGHGAKGTDFLFGPVEFISYCMGVLMADVEKNGRASIDNNIPLKEFLRWNLTRVLRLYEEGKELMPWDDMLECLNILKGRSDGEKIRTFMKDVIGFDINALHGPDNPYDEDADNGKPNEINFRI